jgi:lipoate-protein ligase A
VLVFRSSSTDVYSNLAAEDVLLNDEFRSEPMVLIYRNRDAVVLGKNQVPWRECAVSRLDSLGVKLARRISGGGAVYHDAGNINIAVMVPREWYRRDDLLGVFIAGLARAGVDAEIAGVTSLTVAGKKISGNAFCYRRDRVLHHGTFLWKADLEKMRAALTPELPSIATRAIASVPMPVMNLSDRLADEYFVEAILDALSKTWGVVTDVDFDPWALPGFTEHRERMCSWDWVFGASPDFEVEMAGGWVRVHRGIIAEGRNSGSRFVLG